MLCGKKNPTVKFYGPHAFTVNYVPTSFPRALGRVNSSSPKGSAFKQRISSQTRANNAHRSSVSLFLERVPPFRAAESRTGALQVGSINVEETFESRSGSDFWSRQKYEPYSLWKSRLVIPFGLPSWHRGHFPCRREGFALGVPTFDPARKVRNIWEPLRLVVVTLVPCSVCWFARAPMYSYNGGGGGGLGPNLSVQQPQQKRVIHL